MREGGYIPIAVRIPAGKRDEIVVETESRMDEATFRAFYEDIAPGLRAYIRRACGDAALADDLLQEAFYRFLRARLPSLERWQIKAYLYRTAASLLTDHWRRLDRERRWKASHLFDRSEPSVEPPEEGNEMRLFRRLKPREQTLLWLAYVEGLDHRQLALALQLSDKSVRVLLFRARKSFAAALRKEGFGGEADLGSKP
jgi:RNA polymerase sigma-70 factor (ECF subfamily)